MDTPSTSRTQLPLQSQTPPHTFLNSTAPTTPSNSLPATSIPLRPLTPTSTRSTWNSHHPCFPHRNPHVPLTSPLYHSTRIIRIPRDYMYSGDLTPAFSNIYPEILEPWISVELFREVVETVNEGLRKAFDPWSMRNWADAVMGTVTGGMWEEVAGTAARREVESVEAWLREVNERLQEEARKAAEGGAEDDGRGLVKIVELRRCGFLNVSER